MLSDLYAIDLQARHQDTLEMVMGSVFNMQGLMASDWAWTGLVDGRVKACVGARGGEIWAFLAKDMKQCAVPFVRHSIQVLDKTGPVTAWIDKDHPEAVRLATLTGFRPSTNGFWTRP